MSTGPVSTRRNSPSIIEAPVAGIVTSAAARDNRIVRPCRLIMLVTRRQHRSPMRSLAVLFLFAYAVSGMGCDPIRTTHQSFVVRVVDTVSETPAAGVTVKMKDDFESRLERSDYIKMSGERRSKLREAWDSQPWCVGTTNEAGDATLTLKVTMLDRTRGSTPPLERDVITGEQYQVRLETGDEERQLPGLMMEPGQIASGSGFSVSVVRIDAPEYVKPAPRHSDPPERFP